MIQARIPCRWIQALNLPGRPDLFTMASQVLVSGMARAWLVACVEATSLRQQLNTLPKQVPQWVMVSWWCQWEANLVTKLLSSAQKTLSWVEAHTRPRNHLLKAIQNPPATWDRCSCHWQVIHEGLDGWLSDKCAKGMVKIVHSLSLWQSEVVDLEDEVQDEVSELLWAVMPVQCQFD